MGDRIEDLERECIYCKHKNKDLFFAPTCNSYTFQCKKCGKINFITCDLEVKKLEEVKLKDVTDGFKKFTNVGWSDNEINRVCQETFKQIQKWRK